MKNRILTFQDVSCLGQCSLTVALPILSACGFETAILPASLLSTHTMGFHGFTFLDLSSEIQKIMEHWKREAISFGALYTGYLGSVAQIENAEKIAEEYIDQGGTIYVDPAMADFGKLYPGFDQAYVHAMKRFCGMAGIILPNITEACLLADLPYQEKADEAFLEKLFARLHELGPKTVVLTGASLEENKNGVIVSVNGKRESYSHRSIPKRFHGTGDVFASAFVGAHLHGKSLLDSARIAADFVLSCIENTQDDPDHWYGVKFEPLLGDLIKRIEG